MIAEFNETSYSYLIKLLNKRFYETMDVSELQQINEIYKALDFKIHTWLS